jgi:hypothetical protein
MAEHDGTNEADPSPRQVPGGGDVAQRSVLGELKEMIAFALRSPDSPQPPLVERLGGTAPQKPHVPGGTS